MFPLYRNQSVHFALEINRANQLSGFYIMGILVVKGLIGENNVLNPLRGKMQKKQYSKQLRSYPSKLI